MYRRLLVWVIALFCLANLYGCLALFAGAAGGAGTAVWLSGKLSQEVNATFEKAIQATQNGLESLQLHVTKETVEDKVAQIMSDYSDGRTVWVDVRRVAENASQIDVRVGATGDKEAAHKVLDSILKYL